MKKDLLALGFVVLLVGFLLSGTKIQSVDDYYLTHLDDITEDSETVFLTIRCDTLLDNMDSLSPNLHEYVPDNGVILPMTEYVLRPGDTAFDLLDRAVRHNQIQMEFQGADKNIYNSVYIRGIGYLYEFSCGPLSGWMYRVNGRFPAYGVSRYSLQNSDVVEFLYTCNLGRDVGCGMNNLWEEK